VQTKEAVRGFSRDQDRPRAYTATAWIKVLGDQQGDGAGASHGKIHRQKYTLAVTLPSVTPEAPAPVPAPYGSLWTEEVAWRREYIGPMMRPQPRVDRGREA